MYDALNGERFLFQQQFYQKICAACQVFVLALLIEIAVATDESREPFLRFQGIGVVEEFLRTFLEIGKWHCMLLIIKVLGNMELPSAGGKSTQSLSP
jgi:hypothetical protein